MNMVMNNKAFYVFIKYLSIQVGISLNHERYKLIALDKYKALSQAEVEVKNIKDSFLYTMSNCRQVFSQDLISKSYYLLTGEIIDINISNNIVMEFFKNYNCDCLTLAAIIHLYILNNVHLKAVEYAFIITNYVLKHKGCSIVIPKSKYSMMNKKELILYFLDNKEGDVKANHINQEYVLKEIAKDKCLLTGAYSVENMYLYGSFVKGTNTEYSDIDLLVVFKEHLECYKKNRNINILINIYSERFNANVDVINFTDILEGHDMCELENTIKIF